MNDIVKECREACCEDYLPNPCQVGQRAADEIERLRKECNDRNNLAIANERLWEELRLLNGNSHPGYIIGVHWMAAAYGRICAGENEAEVMADYGYTRAADY